MAFPVVAGTATTNGTTAATSHAVNLPASIGAGETLLAVVRATVAGAIGWPAGWTELVETAADASDDVTAVAWRKADGTEGATITVTHGNGKLAAITGRITGASDPAVLPPEISAVTTGTSTTPNPGAGPSPSGGAKDYLWMWVGGWEGEQTSPPAGTPLDNVNPKGADTGTAGAVATNCRVAWAEHTENVASYSGPAWTISASDDWTAWTLAVHPATLVDADAEISWAELEIPFANADAEISWAEFEVPTADARADVAWAEVEVPFADADTEIAWAELQVPDLLSDADAEVAWSELEVPTASANAEVAWAELEVPTANANAEIAWTELEVPFADAASEIAWSEFEVPFTSADAEISWAEFEVPLALADAEIAWAEFEVPTADAEANIAWSELEVELAPADAEISWAEFEVPALGDGFEETHGRRQRERRWEL